MCKKFCILWPKPLCIQKRKCGWYYPNNKAIPNLVDVDMIASNVCIQWKMVSLGLIHQCATDELGKGEWNRKQKKKKKRVNNTNITGLCDIVLWPGLCIGIDFGKFMCVKVCRFSYGISYYTNANCKQRVTATGSPHIYLFASHQCKAKQGNQLFVPTVPLWNTRIIYHFTQFTISVVTHEFCMSKKFIGRCLTTADKVIFHWVHVEQEIEGDWGGQIIHIIQQTHLRFLKIIILLTALTMFIALQNGDKKKNLFS